MKVEEIKQHFPGSDIKLQEPLSKYTYTETGGPAEVLIFPKSQLEVKDLVRFIHEQGFPLTILGNASNLIVKDGGIKGVVLMLTEMNQVHTNGTSITAEAGATIIEVSQIALENRLTGLEFSCGIPGSVGGAVYMNAGAYGGEVKDVIKTVDVITRQGEIKTLENEEMDFTYRNSILQETGDIVLSTTFELSVGDYDVIKQEMDHLTELRTSKQPLEYPSCGSVFKRPEGHFTGKLIQDAGLQGLKWGGAQISTKHAGFIVNIDQATATDYIELIAHIQKEIWDIYQVRLETEVRIIGEDI